MKRNILAALSIIISVNTFSQVIIKKPDSLKIITVEEVVITASRTEEYLSTTGTSMAVLGEKQLESYPEQRFSSILPMIPGLTVSNTDGTGRSPIVGVRGFYGGGEAEYLKVMVDGIAVNDLENGLVNWNLIPLDDIRRIELVKGGLSAAYGDAAMGGVLNVITGNENQERFNAMIGLGSLNSYNIKAGYRSVTGKIPFKLFAGHDISQGYRENSDWKSTGFGGNVEIPVTNQSKITLSTINSLINTKEPGPLTDSLVDLDRQKSLSYFGDDSKSEKRYSLLTNYLVEFNNRSKLNAHLGLQVKELNNQSTLIQPVFIVDTLFQPVGMYDTSFYGDSKRRHISTSTVKFGVTYQRELRISDETNLKMLAGWDMSAGIYKSIWTDLFQGFEADYSSKPYTPETENVSGKGSRLENGVFLSAELNFLRHFKMIAGLRYDQISDRYHGENPDTTFTPSVSSFSPKIGIVAEMASGNKYQSTIYLSGNQSFKAPTIDQLADLKTGNFAVFLQPFPNYRLFIPYQAQPFANPALKPQKSTTFELGTYQRFILRDQLSFVIHGAAFTTRVIDEIDFELASLTFKNLSETWHRGFEASVSLDFASKWKSTFSYTLNNVTFKGGEYDGKQLKGIPLHNIQAYVGYGTGKGIRGALVLNYQADNYLDDENTQKLNDFGFINLKIGYKFTTFIVNLGIDNVLDSRYSSSGYNLYGTNFYFPASGRILKTNIEFIL